MSFHGRQESEFSIETGLNVEKETSRIIRTYSINHLKENGWAYLFLMPSLILFALFLFFPLLRSIYLSLYLTDPQGRIVQYVGMGNYVALFTDPYFFHSLKTTGLFALYTVPTTLLLALPIAYLTHQKIKGRRVFQFIFSLPLALSVGTASIIWLLLFHPSMGMLNYFLSWLGLSPIFWLSDPRWALLSVSLMTIWLNFGFAYLILLSGLQSIPEEVYESAKIDGAGLVRSFFRITFPLLTPNLFFLVIVSSISALQTFGQIHLLTQGGPAEATNVLVYRLYQDAFINYRFGIGSAEAIFLFLLVLLLTAIQFLFLERKVHYQ
ncbi:ABC transporter, permease protein [[Clostridium] ultunense Esp]|nr:ABC transporter, permease protein [[Clostridium] ultunense Esp]